MEVVVNKLDGCRRSIEITVPSEEPDKEYQKLLKDFQRNLQIPGFRRGKVPSGVVIKRFGKELIQEVIEKMVPKTLGEAIEKEGLRPVEQPMRDDIQYEEGQPLKIRASFEVMPEIDLEKRTGFAIKIDGKKYAVDKKAIDEQLESLRQRMATYEPVEDDRPVAMDDFVLIDFRGVPHGDEAVPFKRDDVTVQVVDADKDAGFSHNLMGARVGLTKEFTVDFPKDYQDVSVAGSKVDYTVEVKEIKTQNLPDLDDEFAKDLGQFEGLKDLREEIKNQLQAENDTRKREEIEKLLVEAILKDNPDFELPQVMVQRQLLSRENELRRSMQSGGYNPDNIGFDWPAFRKEAQPDAELGVRRIMLLDTIADKEKIEVSTKEIKAEIDAFTASSGRDPRELRREMLEDGRYEAIGSHVRDRKVFDWLIENNDIKEGKK